MSSNAVYTLHKQKRIFFSGRRKEAVENLQYSKGKSASSIGFSVRKQAFSWKISIHMWLSAFPPTLEAIALVTKEVMDASDLFPSGMNVLPDALAGTPLSAGVFPLAASVFAFAMTVTTEDLDGVASDAPANTVAAYTNTDAA